MRKYLVLALAFFLMFSAMPLAPAYAGAAYQDGTFAKIGDWFATLGKDGLEKERIITERRAKRMKKYMEKQAKKAGKEAEKAGEEMKDKLGF